MLFHPNPNSFKNFNFYKNCRIFTYPKLRKNLFPGPQNAFSHSRISQECTYPKTITTTFRDPGVEYKLQQFYYGKNGISKFEL
jgi:hypothetical protein